MRKAPSTTACCPGPGGIRARPARHPQAVRGTPRPLRRPTQRVGEYNTKAGLIEPIIAALGWDVHPKPSDDNCDASHSRCAWLAGARARANRHTSGPRVRYIPVSQTERRLTLHDVLGSGRLPAGSRLETDYLGQHHTAELLADGQIRFQDETYGSLSSAGVAVKQAVRGPEFLSRSAQPMGGHSGGPPMRRSETPSPSRLSADASRLVTPPDEQRAA